jgi:CRP-like cAMP-binding protein
MSSKVVLSGDLEFLGLGDILQLIGSNGATGILHIISKYKQKPGLIYFKKGNIIHAVADSLTGLDAAYTLFGWTEGEFEFNHEEAAVNQSITTNRMEIILDGLRMKDEGSIETLGPVTFEKRPDDTPGKGLHMPIIKGPLVDYTYVVAEDKFTYGQNIVKQNTHGGWIWVILEGMVDIIKETPEGNLPLLRIGDGAFIGSITTFLFQNNIRNASANAASTVQLGVLDSQRLSREFSSQSREFRDVITSLDNRLRQVTDRTIDIYLKRSDLRELTKNKKPVVKQGTKDDKIYTIKRGEVVLVKKVDEIIVPLAILGKGDFLGKAPFMDLGHEPEYATVFASKDFEVTKLDPESLNEEYDQLPPMLKNMVDNLSTCVSMTSRVAIDFQKKNVKKNKSS